MIVVVASRGDALDTAALACAWQDDVRVLTARDLATPGWYVDSADPASSRAVVGGAVVPVDEVRGVLTRLPAVTENELTMLAQEDRGYAAAEMTAFLAAWLTSLECPVLNRPTGAGLCAPDWRLERYVLTAARLGLPVRPWSRQVPGPAVARPLGERGASGGPAVTVTVIGDQHLGTSDGVVAERARALATAAGVDLLVVRFDGREAAAQVVDASPWANIHDAATVEALGNYFAARRPALARGLR